MYTMFKKKNRKDRYSYLKTSSNKNENKTKACHYLEKPEHTQLGCYEYQRSLSLFSSSVSFEGASLSSMKSRKSDLSSDPSCDS